MFTKITLTNFKSFDNITFDLCNKANTPNNLILIYGKNGAGKSNIVSSFALLKDSLITMSSFKQYEDFIKNINSDENIDFTTIINNIKKDITSTEKIIKEYRSVNTSDDELTTCEYQFILKNKNVSGNYIISYDSKEIVFEEMVLNLNERKGVVFSFKKEENYRIKPAITSNKEFYINLVHQANMYWGKHSFLSIIQNEFLDKSYSFARNTINSNFLTVFNFFLTFTCKINGIDFSLIDVMHGDSIFSHPRKGYLRNCTTDITNICEEILTIFLNSADNRIIKAKYKTETVNNGLSYELYLTEKQSNNLIELSQDKESNGTKSVIDLLFHLLNALLGGCVILDECDSAIHDLLFSDILKNIYPVIKGQLIITTHNTTLMENKILKNNIYIISNNKKTSITPVIKNSNRIYESNNIRDKYFKGEYNGVPKYNDLNYDLLTNRYEELIYKYYKVIYDNSKND